MTYGVPGGHVLLHTLGHASRLTAGEAGAGLGNTLLEAVGVDFLAFSQLPVSTLSPPPFDMSLAPPCSLTPGALDTSTGFS